MCSFQRLPELLCEPSFGMAAPAWNTNRLFATCPVALAATVVSAARFLAVAKDPFLSGNARSMTGGRPRASRPGSAGRGKSPWLLSSPNELLPKLACRDSFAGPPTA